MFKIQMSGESADIRRQPDLEPPMADCWQRGGHPNLTPRLDLRR
jgi:hypothetical protein